MVRSLLLCSLLVAAPAAPADVLSAGRILVATTGSSDPDFARSVVLLIHSDARGAIGILLNRPTEVPLSKVYPSLAATRHMAWFGGPVAIGARALVKSPAARPGLARVFGDVWTTADSAVIVKLAGTGMSADVFRVYAGYAGWSAGELRNEVRAGLWKVVPGDARIVFSSRPDLVWSVLNR
jgi:putative transcriptional regulator